MGSADVGLVIKLPLVCSRRLSVAPSQGVPRPTAASNSAWLTRYQLVNVLHLEHYGNQGRSQAIWPSLSKIL